ncbi:MAG: NfeD family protein [Verrucomicrobiae bacterium]|nr:NfeD family protein [Verrucomicrobiae bacterium]
MIVYVICLTVGLLFTFISAIASHFFGGHDAPDIGTGGAAEAGFDSSGVPGISFFSPTVLSIFVTAFGAFGMIFSKIGPTQSPWLSAPLALTGGGIVAMFGFWLFNAMFKKTQSSSESRVGTLVGQVAAIITPIPKNGVGEIAYVQGGARYTAPARTEDGSPIPSGRPVKITRIVGTQFYVETTS